MKLNELILIGDCIEHLSEHTDTGIDIIIECLSGTCFSEEDAGRIREYHIDETDI